MAEFLFVILAQVPLGGISNNNTANLNGHFNGVVSSKNSTTSYNQKRGNSASSSSSWQANANNLQCSPHLISLAPYVASLLLKSIFGSNIPPSIDWIFWGLAKVYLYSLIDASYLFFLKPFPCKAARKLH